MKPAPLIAAAILFLAPSTVVALENPLCGFATSVMEHNLALQQASSASARAMFGLAANGVSLPDVKTAVSGQSDAASGLHSTVLEHLEVILAEC